MVSIRMPLVFYAIAQPPSSDAKGPRPSRMRGRRKFALYAVIIAFVCTIVLVLAIFVLGIGNGDLPGIRNGQYISYDVTAVPSEGRTLTGTLRLEISNVTSSNLTMKLTMTIDGRTTSMQSTLNYSKDWSTVPIGTTEGLGGSSPDYFGQAYLGQESLSTVYGTKTVYHYSRQYSTFIFEFWSDANGCPYKFWFQYYLSGTTVTCTLHGTNIKDFKS